MLIPTSLRRSIVLFLLSLTILSSTHNIPSLQAATTQAWTSPALPLEVLGPDQTVETFTLHLPSGAETVTGLRLQVNHLTYQGKASIRFNGGSWLTLSNKNVKMPAKEVGFLGMGGILDTIRFTVPLAAGTIRNGTNRIDFRYNDLGGVSIGYRVLDINLLAGTRELLPASAFTYTDPATWRPPIDTVAARDEGRRIWYSSTISERGVTMNAHCTDCHAHDGRDLKYFNYSNRSIIERSLYHGLTLEEGQKVASYIRSLNIPYEPAARPWNPPYQPGPGLDAKPLRSWAAGAGLSAVIEKDTDILRHIFPNGITTNALDVQRRSINTREIPINVQLPTWNQWLPRVHPLDQYDGIYAGGPLLGHYEMLRANIPGRTRLQAARYVRDQSSLWDGKMNDSRIVVPPVKDPTFPLWASHNRDKLHWRVVKTWEIMTEFGLENYGHEIFGTTSPGGSPISDRRWFHGEIFRLGPHIAKAVKTKTFYAESMQWYQLQLILHDGNRSNPVSVPIDWGYLHALNQSTWQNPNRTTTYGILVLNVIKGLEISANGLSVTNERGWNYNRADIHRLAPGNTLRVWYESIPIETRRAVAEACLTQWLEHALRYSREEYAARPFFRFTLQRQNYIRDLAVNFAAIGVRSELINGICDFGERLFPDYDWNQHRR